MEVVETDETMSRWYVLKTRPRQEKAVRELLVSYNKKCFVPVRMEKHEYANGRSKMIEVPLLPSTCFLFCRPDDRFSIVNELKYKTTLLVDRFTNASMVIPDKQMSDFMLALSVAGDDALCQVEFEKGDRVVVTSGQFEGVEGFISRIDGHRKFVITLGDLANFTLQVPLKYLKLID